MFSRKFFTPQTRDIFKRSEFAEGNAFFLLICHMFPISHLTILGFCVFGELAMVRPEESPLQILTSDGLIQPQEVTCLSI